MCLFERSTWKWNSRKVLDLKRFFSSVDTMVSLRSVMGANRKPPSPMKPPSHDLVSDALISELQFQIKESEDFKKELQRRKNEDLGRPDYSWLMNSAKSYRITQVTRMEIEEISKLIGVDSVSTIISQFRELINKEIPVDKLASYLKFVLHQHVNGKDKPQAEKYENYKQLKGLREEYTARSSSAATLQPATIDKTNRPLSAPLSNNRRILKRGKVHPGAESGKNSNDSCVIKLEDLDENENGISFFMPNDEARKGYGTTYV